MLICPSAFYRYYLRERSAFPRNVINSDRLFIRPLWHWTINNATLPALADRYTCVYERICCRPICRHVRKISRYARPHADFDLRARIILLSGLLIIDGTLGSLLIYRSLNTGPTCVYMDARIFGRMRVMCVSLLLFLTTAPSRGSRDTNGYLFPAIWMEKYKIITASIMTYNNKLMPSLFPKWRSDTWYCYIFSLAFFVTINWKSVITHISKI